MKPRKYGPFAYSAIARREPWKWPNGARLALWICPNIEIFHLDVPMPGDSQERPSGKEKVPMVRQWAQRDFGNRVGVWRVFETLERHGIRGTAALNSDLCEPMPEIVDECVRLGWEIIGHGRTNTHRVNEIPPEEERALVRTVFDTIERSAGSRPVGWLGSGLQETWTTLDYLIENGARWVADWVNDDQPYMMDVDGEPLVSIPYSFELNDSAAFWRNKQSAAEFEQMICDAFEVLYAEGEHAARVMCISLHPFIIGQANKIGSLDRALRHVMAHEGVWAATGSEICDAYLQATGQSLPARTVPA